MELGSPIEAGKTAYLVESRAGRYMQFRSEADSVPPVGLKCCLHACALMVVYATYFRVRDRPQNNRK